MIITIVSFLKRMIEGIASKLSRLGSLPFVLQAVLFMGKIVSFLKRRINGITNKWLMFGFGVLSFVLLVVLLLVMFSDSTAQNVGGLFGTMNKAETIQLIGRVIGGVLFIIGSVVFIQWIIVQVRAAKKRIADFGKDSMSATVGRWIMFIFTVFFIGLLIVLLVVLVSVMLSDDVTKWVGNLFGIQCDKIEIIKFIGWAIGGVSVVTGLAVLILHADVQMRAVEEKITDSKEGIIDNVIRKWIMFIFTVLFIVSFIVLLVVLVWVVLSGSAAELVRGFLGIEKNDKIQIVEFIGLAISGTLVAIGLVFLSQRTDAQVRAAEAQVENNRLVEKGHAQERFKAATEHLGSKSASVRIAAFYEFVHLIKGNGKEYRKNTLDILYAHMRATTDDFANREDVKKAKRKNESIKLTEEIQGLFDVLFKSKNIDLSGVEINLARIDLSGMNLSEVNLFEANLSEANLSKANLSKANLSKANLSGANLSGANLPKANLSKANLSGANLSETKLSSADLSWADLSEANLSKADLSPTDLSLADLFPEYNFETCRSTNLSEANLSEANLSEANLSEANLSGAKLFMADLSGADLSEADLSEAEFAGAKIYTAGTSPPQGPHLVKLGGASYTNATTFPWWIEPPKYPLPDDDVVGKFPEEFGAPRMLRPDEQNNMVAKHQQSGNQKKSDSPPAKLKIKPL